MKIITDLFLFASVFLLTSTLGEGNAETSDRKITIILISPITIAASNLSGTAISGYSKSGELLFSAGFPKTWNTYSANDPGEMHLFVRTENMDTSFKPLPRTVQGLHSAYLTKNTNKLFVFEPLGNTYQIKPSGDGSFSINNQPAAATPSLFRNLGYQYSDSKDETTGEWMVRACKIAQPGHCEQIAVIPKTVVFAYGGNEYNTVAVTSQGETLFHNKEGWCRGNFLDDSGAKCDKTAKQPIPSLGHQKYSSINTAEGTLMGGYPAGRFWVLGDGVLTPSKLSPYTDGNPAFRELQSVSIFCGDLYTGYYPRGEIWRKALGSSKWEKIYRLFSHPTDLQEGEVPYRSVFLQEDYHGPQYGNGAFLAQRVTSMMNFQNSLFAASSNLGDWRKDTPPPPFLTKEQTNEYGLVHVKSDSNCLTTTADDKVNLRIELDSQKMLVYSNGKKIAETQLHDFDSRQIDRFEMNNGIFGLLNDKQMKINVETK